MLTLHLYDKNDNALRKKGYVAPNQPGVIYTAVGSLQDIKDELRRIGGLGGRIDVLWVHAHGAPGIVAMKSGWVSGVVCIDAATANQLTKVCALAMAPQAKVYFTACDLGYGAKGEAFLRAAGPAMLGHGGGIMLASTAITASGPLLGEWLPPWGRVRAAKVSPGGAVVITTSGFTTILPTLPKLPGFPMPVPAHFR